MSVAMLRVEYALTSDRTMKALTGLTRPEFRALVPAFGQALYDQALQRDPPRQRRPGGGGPATLKTAAAKLFFNLIYVKCYPTFDVAAVLYGVHRSRAHRWTQDLLPVLEQTLGYQMILPERQIHEVEGFFPTLSHRADALCRWQRAANVSPPRAPGPENLLLR